MRSLPGLGLKAFFALGEDGWNDEMDANLTALSALVQPRVVDIVNADPGAPVDGQIYFFGATHPTNPNKVAIRDNGAWVYIAAFEGLELYNVTDNKKYRFDGATLSEITASVSIAVEDEGVEELAAVQRFNFTGSGVAVNVVGSEAEISITGGGGGSSIVIPDAPVTVPSLADFTARNAGTLAISDAPNGRGILLNNPGGIGWPELRGILKPAPAGAFNLYARIEIAHLGLSDNDRFGLAVRNIATGKVMTLGFFTHADGRLRASVMHWTGSYSGNGGWSELAMINHRRYFWLRVECDGTNIRLYHGDGYNWTLLASETNASFLGGAVDEIGFMQQIDKASLIYLNSFSTVAPAAGGTVLGSGGAGGASYTDEQVRDVVAAMLVGGANVTLTNNDAGDSLTIAAAGGGGGGWGFSPPSAASLALASGDATNLTLTDDADVGLMIDAGAPVAGDVSRVAYRTLTTPSGDWKMVAKILPWIESAQHSNVALFVRDSVGGRIASLTMNHPGNFNVYYWAGLTGYTSAPGSWQMNWPVNWLQIEKVGADLNFKVSPCGKNWETLMTRSATEHLAAVPNQVGLQVLYARNFGSKVRATIPYFALTGSAV